MKWSNYSLDFFEKAKKFDENIFLSAVAGAGKTTNLKHLINNVLTDRITICFAFNSHIAEEMKSKITNPCAFIGTVHSFGFKALKNKFGKKLETNKNKYIDFFKFLLTETGVEEKKIDAYAYELNRFFHLRRYLLTATCDEILNSEEYDFDFNDYIKDKINEIIENAEEYGEKSLSDVVDFSDMIYYPNKYDLVSAKADLICVDEAQDLSLLQTAYIKKHSLTKDSIFVFVGDRRQSIYGFAGANPSSVDSIIKDYSCREMPLSITYRCPKSHVSLAKELNSALEAWDQAIEGEVRNLELNIDGIAEFAKTLTKTREKTIFLSRVNFNLVSLMYALIKKGVFVNYTGKDIGYSLCATAQYICDGDFSCEKFRTQLDRYANEKAEKYKKSPAWASFYLDKIECLKIILDENPQVSSLEELKKTILDLFQRKTMENSHITFSTIHKAKGLECEHSAFLYPSSIPHRSAKGALLEQEYNLKYIALTRSTNKLTLIEKE